MMAGGDLRQVSRDVDLILWSARLCDIYRFRDNPFWRREARDADYAARVEPAPRIESVADHSWHIADIVLVIAPRFENLDIGRCLGLAVLHDKLEIITGDKSALGRSLRDPGEHTHAFDAQKREEKHLEDREALNRYAEMLEGKARYLQRDLIEDLLDSKSAEALFVKALDKLHPLTFILRKKKGDMRDAHLRFTIRYAATAIDAFPDIHPYFEEFKLRLLRQVAFFRGIDVKEVAKLVSAVQLQLPLVTEDSPTAVRL